MSVYVEKDGPITTVILDRPEVRNAVDGPTAAALTNEFTHGLDAFYKEGLGGAARFTAGAGRHGVF